MLYVRRLEPLTRSEKAVAFHENLAPEWSINASHHKRGEPLIGWRNSLLPHLRTRFSLPGSKVGPVVRDYFKPLN